MLKINFFQISFSLVIKWRFVSRVENQMKYFMKGFNALIPQNLLQIFDENEVEVSNFFFSFISDFTLKKKKNLYFQKKKNVCY